MINILLPLIQSWMPNITIIEPQELKDEYIKKLNEAIKNLELNKN